MSVIDVKYTGISNENFTNGKIYTALLITDDSLSVPGNNKKAIDFAPDVWQTIFTNLGVNGSQRRKDARFYNKYTVINNFTDEAVHDCFVLKPLKDKVARIAILAYADATDNQELADDLRNWLKTFDKSI